MSFSSVGDLAQSLSMRRQNFELRSQMNQLTQELASGRKTDIGQAVRGDFAPLAGMERSLALLDGFATARADMVQKLTTAQTSLDAVRGQVSEFGTSLLAATGLNSTTTIEPVIADAGARFEATVGYLNSRTGETHLFGGTATDRAPLASAADMLAELKLQTASAVTSADFIAAVDDWFSQPGGGFETMGYLGSDISGGAVEIGQNQVASMEVKASDPEIRDVLKNLAMSALLADGALAGDDAARRDIAAEAATGLIAANKAVIATQARLGTSENRIETVTTQANAEQNTLSLARNSIVSADPYETASELEQVQLQLETLYILTSRMSQLSLTEYLR